MVTGACEATTKSKNLVVRRHDVEVDLYNNEGSSSHGLAGHDRELGSDQKVPALVQEKGEQQRKGQREMRGMEEGCEFNLCHTERMHAGDHRASLLQAMVTARERQSACSSRRRFEAQDGGGELDETEASQPKARTRRASGGE